MEDIELSPEKPVFMDKNVCKNIAHSNSAMYTIYSTLSILIASKICLLQISFLALKVGKLEREIERRLADIFSFWCKL